MKHALITGITGQDGSYLAELLLDKGYEVFGLVRRTSTKHMPRIEHLLDRHRLTLIPGDVADAHSVRHAVEVARPHELYNLAAMSFVGSSWEQPELSIDVTGKGALHCLEAIRATRLQDTCKFYQASSSEMFGNVVPPHNEDTPFNPCSPYACAKMYAHNIVRTYRESYGMFACSGILLNHESPRRGAEFVTQKIATQVVEIAAGLRDVIELGNIDARRDWGHAQDYVEAMHLMLQQVEPKDYVVGMGTTHSVREFLERVFHLCNIHDWEKYVRIDDNLKRPAEVWTLQADARRIRALGWQPVMTFDDLVLDMVNVAKTKVELGTETI